MAPAFKIGQFKIGHRSIDLYAQGGILAAEDGG
jgi:hypothetical protein